MSSRLATFRATIKILAPLLASNLATLRPMPWEPPVMITVYIQDQIGLLMDCMGVYSYSAINGKFVLACEATHSVVDED